VAIWPPLDIREKISTLQKKLTTLPMKFKIVKPANIHVTVSFLGERREDEVNNIKSELDMICSTYNPFEIILKGIKLIPNKNYIRVIAVDVIENEELLKIIRNVSNSLKGDYKPPHLTLCRVKSIKDKKRIIEFAENYESTNFGKFIVNEIALVKSTLTPSGPIYETIHVSKLKT